MKLKLFIFLLTTLFINALSAQIEAPPPPPTRSTVKFVAPIIKKDEEVQEQEQKADNEILDKKENESNQGNIGNDEAPPMVEDKLDIYPLIEAPAKREEKVYGMFDVQKEPSFPGGSTEMYKFIAAKLQYPVMAKEYGISGNVVVSFVVDAMGQLSDIQILKDIGGGCGKEAVRLVKAMPLWIPGEANGIKVKVRYTLPLKFKLE